MKSSRKKKFPVSSGRHESYLTSRPANSPIKKNLKTTKKFGRFYKQLTKMYLIDHCKCSVRLYQFITLCCQHFLQLGDSRKYPYLYHGRLLGFPKGGGFFELEFQRNGGGGIYNYWISAGIGGFHRWDFWSRKSRVSPLKTQLLWTSVVRK